MFVGGVGYGRDRVGLSHTTGVFSSDRFQSSGWQAGQLTNLAFLE